MNGTFAGLPQLATFTNGPLAWRINYQGGDGNDVTLALLSGGAVLLAPVSNQTIMAGATLSVTNTASDPDTPPQRLLFSLLSAPSGACH